MWNHLRSGIRQWRALGVGEKHLWRDARMVFAEVPVDAEVVRDWLPFGLTLAEPARATVFIGDYPHTTFAPHYQEAALLLHAKLFGVLPVVYCPWMVLNNDRALILGREMLGLPKKMALVSFSERRGKISGSVVRHGVELLRIEGRVGEPVAKPKPGLGQAVVGLRGLLNVLLPAHLLLFRPTETVHACHALQDAEVTLRNGEDDPVGVATGPAAEVTVRTCDIGAGLLPLRVFPVSPLFPAHLMALRLR
jgi:acetoacetate decarboxylase